jgi:peptidyl-prolyl cis-trans isomerase SurA
MKKLTIFLVGLITACSGINLFKGSEEQPIVSIANDQILADEFKYAFNKNRSLDSVTTKTDLNDYLELYINFKLKVIEAENRGMDTTSEFRKEYESYIGQLDNSYLKAGNDTDSLVNQAFNRLQFEVRASHILLTVEESASPQDTLIAYNKAIALRDSIENGATFADIAIRNSEDPSAKQNRGDLGYFSAFQMVYPFENAAYETPIGKISMPVRTKFGYHIIKVTDKRPIDGKVSVAHIMLRTRDGAKDKAIDLNEQLLAGADWDQICQQNSEDAQSASRGGVLVPFSRTQIVAEFAEAAFALSEPGEISDPVQTAYGWHIIKLIEKLPVSDFEANKRQLQGQVRRDTRSQISRQRMLDRLAKENNLIENNDNVQTIVDPENHSFGKSKWVFDEDTLKNLELFVIQDSSYTAEKYYRFANKVTNHAKTEVFLYENYRKFKEESLVNYEKAHLADKYDDYKYLRNEYHDGILLFSIMEKEVWAKAGTDSLGLASYYDQHQTEFIDSTKLNAVIFSAANRLVIDSLVKVYPNGETFKNLTLVEKQGIYNHDNQDSQLSLQIESGEFVIEEHAVLQKLALPYTDSLIELGGKWSYIIILRTPDQPLPLNEIKGRIIADYQEVLEQNWLEELKGKYPVEINQIELNKVYKEFEIQ